MLVDNCWWDNIRKSNQKAKSSTHILPWRSPSFAIFLRQQALHVAERAQELFFGGFCLTRALPKRWRMCGTCFGRFILLKSWHSWDCDHVVTPRFWIAIQWLLASLRFTTCDRPSTGKSPHVSMFLTQRTLRFLRVNDLLGKCEALRVMVCQLRG